MKVLLITEQNLTIQSNACYCNFALYGTLENLNLLGELYIMANQLTTIKPDAQPLDRKVEFVSTKHIIFLRPLNKTIGSYIKNYNYNMNKMKEIIPLMDLVVGYLPSGSAYIAFKTAQKFQKPFLSFLVGCPWDMLYNHHRILAKIMAPVRFFSTRYVIKNSQYVHYVTKSFLQHRYPTKGKSLGCSDVNLLDVNSNILTQRLNKIEVRKKDDIVVLVTTAHIDVRFKGHEFVIRAIAYLKKAGYKNYKYELIGQGKGEYLKKLCKHLGVEDQVSFLGCKTSKEVIEILKKADIYIQPSLQEGLPRSVVEAMSVALPCIGFNTGGIPELIDPDFIVRRKDVLGIIEKIKKLQDNSIYSQVAERNFLIAKEYEHSKLTQQIQHFFIEVRQDIA